ncbi:lantibiotic dehydratase [Actinokineospora xionganensis]|uniref:Lantibiotic dehydratase n=1 Tax=Actinokineospora xionganensis TaxID=2684470 RepID=A0ABR7LBU3_9PSEU|nr:lantibiotic dehydratase [Actinokineospora xionganensis]MBC6450155.1 lantibiotic dehydratase [Actinokineospora xionganensis]
MVRLGDRWRLWEQFALRGPGFPAAGVLRLAPAGIAEAADKFAHGDLAGAEWTAFEDLFGEAAVATARALQDIARASDFRAAVAWQNRPVLRSGIEPFLAWTPTAAGRTSMPRQREELVAHYWQRFCVKNDTIGFFGPVGWGRWDATARGIEVDPGEGLVARTNVYFASWAIDTLAKTIGADPDLSGWIAPRRVPFVRITDEGVVVPGRPPQPVSAELLAVLAACDGITPARDLDADEELAELVRRRWVVWRLEVPADARPERHLRGWLDRVGDASARDRGLAMLDVLERGRDAVAAAGPDGLVEALSAVEADFSTLTEAAAVREKGSGTAPCRAIVYSDCTRSATARLGVDMVERLAPLDLLLTAAAWLTSTVAERIMGRVRELFDELGPVDLATFWFACMPVLHGSTDAADVQHEFWKRWADILPLAGRRVQVSSVDITDRVREAFGGTEARWAAARYFSPDVMVTDDGDLVLGELHVASNTLGSSLFVNQHPAPEELLAATSVDHPGPRLLPVLPKEHRSRLSARIRHSLVRDEDYYVSLVDHTVDPARPRTVLSADVQVAERSRGLVAVLPDETEFDLADVFSHVLTTMVMDLFRLLPESDHSPRVTIDRMVVARETWRFTAADLAFAGDKSEARRFVSTRRWRGDLPRFVFVVSPAEPRPFFVDFDSPVYVAIFLKAVRRLARTDPLGKFTVTEMLPTPDQTWLVDDQGRGYTSELRFVAVDD